VDSAKVGDNGAGMTDSFRTAKLARKKRAKWWSQHIPLAYATLIGSFVVIYLGVSFIDRRLPRWLIALGVSPSGVNLLFGTLWCALGIWGIRAGKDYGMGWVVMFVLCLLGGILTLAKAFAFI
jgi:hypothetical protein